MDCKRLASVAFAAGLFAPGAVALAHPAAPSPAADSTDSLADASGDWAGYAHVGYHLDPHWKLELKGGYHADQTAPASAPAAAVTPCAGGACSPVGLALGAYSVVANLVFDALPEQRWVDPFVGFGVSRFQPSPQAMTNPAMRLMQSLQGGSGLGYQAVVGLAFRPKDRLHFDLTYRWADGGAPGLTGLPTALSGRFQDQTVAITVRYALSSPKAAIAPVPGFGLISAGQSAGRLAPTRTVVVETPSHPEALAAEAEAAAVQTALSAGEGKRSQVVVDGHADTAAAADYNQRLAERRAKALADAMAALGVPVSAIDPHWEGEAVDTIAPAVQARAGLVSTR
jgi:hypothetical protein